ncbi:MAG: undecaprenyldiphospho-muramoylpentapeptide beta-N-acetylglucosaminyltransferase [Clostridia bacterium]|nr:undecaprenyldiphospho-muramoylpentapeptide beta-N-acetylglucosaminyltransferase [Clostridia bacterium]
MKVIIAAAGTGGHINPGLAIANKIKEKEPNSEILFVGTNRGLENDLVPRAGYQLKQINAYGFNRQISIDNFKKIVQTFRCVGEMRKTIKQFHPDVVIGTGGYICVPVGLAAKKERVPLILHESNAFPGVAVKMLAKKANKVLVGFEDAKTRLSKAKKVVVTGTPTKVKKQQVSELQKKQMLQALGLNDSKPIILCFGGSQGAKTINESLMKIILEGKNDTYQIIWAAGPAQYEVTKQKLAENQMDIESIPNVKIVPYIYNMEEVMNMVDLVVCRSGAMTITEVANVGKPAIFIPFPFATENHQEYNAKVLEKVGAAKIILDKNLTAEILDKQIHDMVKDKQKLLQMGQKANTIAIPNVEEKIYQELKN